MFTFTQIVIWLGGPLLLATLIAYMVRLPQFTRRITLVVYAAILTAIGLLPLSQSLKLGIDLSGGTILVYDVKEPVPPDFEIDKLVAAINRRVNPAGLFDVTVRGIGSDRVEIVIPRAVKEDVQHCKRILTTAGTLEFRILANRRDHSPLIEQAEAEFPQPLLVEGKTAARWVPVAKSAGPLSTYGEVAVRSDPKLGTLALVVVDDFHVTGELLSRAEGTIDDQGRPAVGFHFSSIGGELFAGLTEANRPDADGFQRRLAILLDGELHSAPTVRDRISSDGIITGNFTSEEVADLAGVLNAGSLPATLDKTPASELTIGPTLGRDTIESGLTAMMIATVLVLLFMLAYYRLAGLIADVAVILNVTMVVGIMAWVKGTWTLPGLAGLALTVGMAVDANVLIFERLREEQQRGRSLRLAIEYAFSRALRPILDSNVTTLLAGVVLYSMGSEQVRGFAVTLSIGLLANLFTAVVVCRLIFDVLERNRWITRVGMAHVFSQPNFDFVGKRYIALGCSVLLITIGLVAVVFRGPGLFDIDFTGGTLAAVRLRVPSDSATVRALAGEVLPDVTVEELQLGGETPGHRFLIRTTLQEQDQVRSSIIEKFGSLLASTRLTLGPIESIPSAPAAEVQTAGVAFPGGNKVQLTFDGPVTVEAVEGYLEQLLTSQGFQPPSRFYQLVQLDPSPEAEAGHVSMQLQTALDRQNLQKVLDGIGQRLAQDSVFERLDNFGGQVAQETQAAAVLAMIASMVVIVGYLWIRFQNVLFGLGAIVALIHDVLIVLGLVAMSRWLAAGFLGDVLLLQTFKINLPMIAGFLTLIGYSVNDTIVVFDRIRELRRKSQSITWQLINDSINQTLSRTLLTGLTTWIVALILYAAGVPTIHGFAFCLVAGVLVGTYSSIYIASPILIWLGTLSPRKKPTSKTVSAPPAEKDAPPPKKPQPRRAASKHRKRKAA